MINEIRGGKKYRDASRQVQAIRIDLSIMSVILSANFVFHCVDYRLDFPEIDAAISADLFHASVLAVHFPKDADIPICPVIFFCHPSIKLFIMFECQKLPLILVFVVLV